MHMVSTYQASLSKLLLPPPAQIRSKILQQASLGSPIVTRVHSRFLRVAALVTPTFQDSVNLSPFERSRISCALTAIICVNCGEING